ncbi:MAG TPA: hypothetical protein VEB86_11970 [Chryseosolibacter sp.]|nr:hypothetical protein [Chryseosolibacter sp.]
MFTIFYRAMRTLANVTLAICLVFFSAHESYGQKGKKESKGTVAEKKKDTEKKAEEKTPVEGEQQVRDIIAFLQYVLNSIGSSETPARDKDVLITESYSKIFADSKVQVEDDLDDKRTTITNKDVVAYLKDVDFFFKDVKFDFNVEKIERSVTPNGTVFYKVSLTRNISGTSSEGKAVNNTLPRYVEINLDPKEQDLKIASIYTNEFDEKETLINWWKNLSFGWRDIFTQKLGLADSVSFEDIKNITLIEDMDLSGDRFMQNLEPLSQLHNLKLLDVSGTQIGDLTPIRNLTELLEINLSGCPVTDLAPLRYATKLLRLNISQTRIRDLSPLEKMTVLQNLEIQETPVVDFTPLSNLKTLLHLNAQGTSFKYLAPIVSLTGLYELNLSRTLVFDLSSLSGMKDLSLLNIDSTSVADIRPLANCKALQELKANYTYISTLDALAALPLLERVYCDQTAITKKKADTFMAARPGVLIVFDSKDLIAWWQKLPVDWQKVFSKAGKIAFAPSKEELATIPGIDSVNFSGWITITDLTPLAKLDRLRVLIASKSGIRDLSPLSQHRNIELLDISETGVNDLSPLATYEKLRVLRADKTPVEKIDPLFPVSALEKVYVDQTTIHDITAAEFLERNPECLLVYKTVHLKRWWSNLDSEWKNVFRQQMGRDTIASRENLHRLAERKSISFADAPVRDLSILNEFVRLSDLRFSGTQITTIPALENLRNLRVLHAVNGPLSNIKALRAMTDLEELNISNTPVDELDVLIDLQRLKTVNCSGTQIKKLDVFEFHNGVETLDCSNTRISQLDKIFHLPLKTLKCYNTKVTSREVEKFKKANPYCNVIYYR